MYKKSGTTGLFAEEFRLEKISKQGDPLERLNKVVEWECFRSNIEKILPADKLVASGAKSYDPLLLFKILILQRYYNLSDAQTEYQILDRLSFCRFLNLILNDRVPDEKTIWLFRENLIQKGLDEVLFNQFKTLLDEHGLIAHEGKILDASFVEAPRQRNTRVENGQIKETGEAPIEWSDKPNKKRQKDVDAGWTKKNNETHFGYNNHIKVDNKHKLIENQKTTGASVHDSQTIDDLLEPSDRGQDVWTDSSYAGAPQDEIYKEYGVNNKVHEKGARNRALTKSQQKNNSKKSKTRVRVEHVFGFMEQSMNKLTMRSIGIQRASGTITLINLTYNLFRYEQINRINGIGLPCWK